MFAVEAFIVEGGLKFGVGIEGLFCVAPGAIYGDIFNMVYGSCHIL